MRLLGAMGLFEELKRRNVFRVAVAYVIVGWILLQVAENLGPALHLPEWLHSGVAFVILLGFPLAILFAWAFEMTPEGIKREKDVERDESITGQTGQKLNSVIAGLLVLAVAYIVYDTFIAADEAPPAAVTANAAAERNPQTAPADTQPASNTIAVLPFLNMSDDADNEYFADGITEELLNLLAKIPELRVTSRSSSFSFKGQIPDIPTVAEKLGVAHVLEGSVRKAGNKVRITAQLIEAATDTHLWSETYDRELTDIFAVQDEISATVVERLHVTLLGEQPKARVADIEAYNLYLRGLYASKQGDNNAWRAARDLARQSIAIDPEYAPAWVLLAVSLRDAANAGFMDLHAGTEEARAAVDRAIAIDPDNVQAWSWLAYIQMVYDFDWQRAYESARELERFNAADSIALLVAANVYRALGDIDGAISLANRAVAADPLNYPFLSTTTVNLVMARDYAAAEREYARYLELVPDARTARARMAFWVLLPQGRVEEADVFAKSSPYESHRATAEAMVAHALGQKQRSDAAKQLLIDDYRDTMAYQVAEVCAYRGEVDEAFEWLRVAYENKDGGISYILIDPLLDPLHADPRWEPLLDEIGLLPYWKKNVL